MKNKILVFINVYGKTSETFISDELDFLAEQPDIELSVLHYGKTMTEKGIMGLDFPSTFMKRWKKILPSFDASFLNSLQYRNGINAILPYLIKFFKGKQYDTIYCHFGTNGKLIAELKALGVIPKETQLIVRFHGLDMLLKKYPIGYYNLLNKHAKIVIAGSEYARNDLKKLGLSEAIIKKLPVGVQNNFIESNSAKKYSHQLNIISIGRLVEFKGHRESLEIMKKLKGDNLDFHYTIIGSGPLLNEIQNTIKNSKSEGNVTLINGLPHEKILKLLQSADIYLYPGIVDSEGRTETQGLANLEAMAMGIPILASNVGGISDYVKDGETGFLCESGNIEQFAEKIKWIKENYYTEEMLKIRKNAVKMVKENYCQEDLNQKLLKILA